MGEITTEIATILDTGALVWLIAGPVVVCRSVGEVEGCLRGWGFPLKAMSI